MHCHLPPHIFREKERERVVVAVYWFIEAAVIVLCVLALTLILLTTLSAISAGTWFQQGVSWSLHTQTQHTCTAQGGSTLNASVVGLTYQWQGSSAQSLCCQRNKE
jgi:hypothetical protein